MAFPLHTASLHKPGSYFLLWQTSDMYQAVHPQDNTVFPHNVFRYWNHTRFLPADRPSFSSVPALIPVPQEDVLQLKIHHLSSTYFHPFHNEAPVDAWSEVLFSHTPQTDRTGMEAGGNAVPQICGIYWLSFPRTATAPDKCFRWMNDSGTMEKMLRPVPSGIKVLPYSPHQIHRHPFLQMPIHSIQDCTTVALPSEDVTINSGYLRSRLLYTSGFLHSMRGWSQMVFFRSVP